jgi:drug/metabolite transporter (DMT)-like permease
MFKAIATFLIGIILIGVFIIINNTFIQQINLPFQENIFLIILMSLIGLIFLGIIFSLWYKEIQIYYQKKKSMKK